ncbi:MAG: NADH-quinone oxidoreductase subunit J family protein [Candidatus Polarisedimenticolia bacterium]
MAPAAVMFYVLASVCAVSAIMVVTRRNPVHAALFLVLAFFCVAGIYVIMMAEFLAAVQVLVYAGGITVLFLFVIMLVPLEGSRLSPPPVRHLGWSLASAALLSISLISYFWNAPSPPFLGSTKDLTAGGGNIEAMGMELYQRYLVPFEIASVLLLVAMIGAVVLAREKV